MHCWLTVRYILHVVRVLWKVSFCFRRWFGCKVLAYAVYCGFGQGFTWLHYDVTEWIMEPDCDRLCGCTGIMGQDLVHPYIQNTTVLCDNLTNTYIGFDGPIAFVCSNDNVVYVQTTKALL